MGLTVAVTGPTGEIGRSAVAALERHPDVERIIGMARRPFDPFDFGWKRTEYRRGDILDRASVDDLVAEADVVIHLAFVVIGSHAESGRVNLAGTRTVFQATVDAQRPTRLVYTSSVAAYGYHAGNPDPLTEDVPARGSDGHYYSRQKAECEAALHEITDDQGLDVYVLRPCIVSGPNAPALADAMPWHRYLPAAVRPISRLLPLLPDPGVRFQLVHHDDVAAAIALAATGAGQPGAYNLAAPGTVGLGEIARATGARAFPVPRPLATAALNLLEHAPLVPAAAEWLQFGRTSIVMDTARARTVLGWEPEYTARQTLDALIASL